MCLFSLTFVFDSLHEIHDGAYVRQCPVSRNGLQEQKMISPLFPQAPVGHFRQKQHSLCIGIFLCIILQFRNRTSSNNSGNVTAVKAYLSPVGKCCVQGVFLLSRPMGVGEAECPTCHFEIKDPRCLFPKLTKKPFPRLSLASPAGPVCCGQGLLHIWASQKGGASRGLCPCGEG